MKWEKALKYTRKHKRMIAVMMAGVIGFACFYSADASVIKDAKKKKNEAQQNLDISTSRSIIYRVSRAR